MKKKRRSFFLLELLICFLILSVCAGLFLYPLRSLRSEVVLLEKLELERLAANALKQIDATLREGKFRKEDVLSGKAIKQDFGTVTFKQLQTETTKDGKTLSLIQATVKLKARMQEKEASRLFITQ
jgi:type II secretory pathway pseudopilin PulG